MGTVLQLREPTDECTNQSLGHGEKEPSFDPWYLDTTGSLGKLRSTYAISMLLQPGSIRAVTAPPKYMNGIPSSEAIEMDPGGWWACQTAPMVSVSFKLYIAHAIGREDDEEDGWSLRSNVPPPMSDQPWQLHFGLGLDVYTSLLISHLIRWALSLIVSSRPSKRNDKPFGPKQSSITKCNTVQVDPREGVLRLDTDHLESSPPMILCKLSACKLRAWRHPFHDLLKPSASDPAHESVFGGSKLSFLQHSIVALHDTFQLTRFGGVVLSNDIYLSRRD